jgi:ABC-type polysaccharide/polyol phosphate export permease
MRRARARAPERRGGIVESTSDVRPGGLFTGPFRAAARMAREVWRFRYLLRSLVLRDLKVKYKRSAIGFLWTFLNPLLTALILIAVFRLVLRIQIRNYWAFLLSGYFAWNAAHQMLASSSTLLQVHSRLIRSVAFPKEILLYGAAIARVIELAAELFLVLAVLAIAHHHTVPIGFVFLPLLAALLVLLSLGFMFPIATASTLFSDVQHGLPIALTSLFYVTPVFYSIEMIPASVRGVALLNPFAGLITLFHQALYEGRVPDGPLLLVTSGSALLVFVLGNALFRRFKDICNELV